MSTITIEFNGVSNVEPHTTYTHNVETIHELKDELIAYLASKGVSVSDKSKLVLSFNGAHLDDHIDIEDYRFQNYAIAIVACQVSQ